MKYLKKKTNLKKILYCEFNIEETYKTDKKKFANLFVANMMKEYKMMVEKIGKENGYKYNKRM